MHFPGCGRARFERNAPVQTGIALRSRRTPIKLITRLMLTGHSSCLSLRHRSFPEADIDL